MQTNAHMHSMYTQHTYASVCMSLCTVGLSHIAVLESRQVVLDVPSKIQGEALGPTSWPLECMVWACADQGKKMATTAREELLKQQSLHVGVKRHG